MENAMGTMRWLPQGKFASFDELQNVLARPEPAPDELVADAFGRFLPSYSFLWSAGYLLPLRRASGLAFFLWSHHATTTFHRHRVCRHHRLR
jgi:hypothetical protein